MRVSIYLNSQLLPFLKETLNYGWEQMMLSDGNISIKEQIQFFRNTEATVQCFLRKYWETQIWIMKWSFVMNWVCSPWFVIMAEIHVNINLQWGTLCSRLDLQNSGCPLYKTVSSQWINAEKQFIAVRMDLCYSLAGGWAPLEEKAALILSSELQPLLSQRRG